jgi:hypothetical protein
MLKFSNVSGTNSDPIFRVMTTHKTQCHQFWFYEATSNTLNMGTKSVPETSGNLHILTWLSGQKNFTEFSCRKSFKSSILLLLYSRHKDKKMLK